MRAAAELDAATIRIAKEHGFSDAQLAVLARTHRGRGPRHPRRARHPPGVQDGRHLCGRVPGAHAVPLLELRLRDRGDAVRADEGRHHRLAGRTASARASSSTTPACTRSFALSAAGLRDRHGQLQPGDGVHRTTTPRTACTSSRSRSRTCSRCCTPSRARGRSLGVVVPAGRSDAARPREGHRGGRVTVLGTSPAAIDLAEERQLFSEILDAAGLPSPPATARRPTRPVRSRSPRRSATRSWCAPASSWAVAAWRSSTTRPACATTSCARRGEVIVEPGKPLLVDRFLDDAIEIDVDALFDGEQLYIGGVMEHLEEAGIHSGDSTLHAAADLARTHRDRPRPRGDARHRRGRGGAGPPERAVRGERRRPLRHRGQPSREPHGALRVQGAGHPLAKAASRIMAGSTIAELIAEGLLPQRDGSRVPLDAPVAVKEAVLPFKRFRTAEGATVDSVLGPEMRSTGEVMGIDRDFPTRVREEQAAAVRRSAHRGDRVHLGRRQRQARGDPARAPAPGARLRRSSPPRARRRSSPATASRWSS